MMENGEIEILQWLAEAGLRGQETNEIFRGFCERCNNIGLPISYAIGLMDTLHPEFEGHAFEWQAQDVNVRPLKTYTTTTETGETNSNWENSIFHHLLETGETEAHQSLGEGAPLQYYRMAELQEEGYTDHFARIEPFPGRGSIGAMNAFYSAWATRLPEGLSEDHLASLRRLTPTLALALKSVGSIRIVKTLARVYLGQDAASRVIDGQIARGSTETIEAVIWLSDLKNFTAISDGADAEQIIPLLNDYSSLVITALHRNGGNVLKLIGDGVLAIFKGPDLEAAAARALKTEREVRKDMALLNDKRAERGDPVTGLYVGLHLGKVFYGNIGSRNRLDFTVVGPAVNEVSRICSTCRTSGRDVLASEDFVAACPPERRSVFADVGEFTLRGVSTPMELFTITPPQRRKR